MKCLYYDELDSTQDEARRLIQSGKVKDITYIIAKSQTHGRGTRGRKWSSPSNSGIYLSVIHIPNARTGSPHPFELTTLYTQACGIACIEAIKETVNIECKLKPINDIYFNDKKLGGILIESRLQDKGISSLISGVGINIKKTNHELDRNIVEPISLEEIMSKEDFKNFSKEKLIENIVSSLCKWYEITFEGNHDLVQKKWGSLRLRT
jgi:BirA family biotin operon repressor/biotin-[acetyl-CoA-carboxylase] ligase